MPSREIRPTRPSPHQASQNAAPPRPACLPPLPGCSFRPSPRTAAAAAVPPVARQQVALQRDAPAVVLAEAMPSKWSDFIRNAPMETVRPLGTRAAAQQGGQRFAAASGGATQSYTSGTAKALYYAPQAQPGGGLGGLGGGGSGDGGGQPPAQP